MFLIWWNKYQSFMAILILFLWFLNFSKNKRIECYKFHSIFFLFQLYSLHSHPYSPHYHLNSSYSQPYSLHIHLDFLHFHPIPHIPHIPTHIPRIPTSIPCILTLIPCIPFILFPSSPIPAFTYGLYLLRFTDVLTGRKLFCNVIKLLLKKTDILWFLIELN